MKLGAQMYTVRAFTKDTDALSETLKRIADIGYTSVQVSGTCEFDAAWLAEELKKNGLVCPITHTKPQAILEDTEKVCRDHRTFGAPYVGIGAMPEVKLLDDAVYSRFVESFLPAAKKIRENGCKLAYHHHSNEFARSTNGSLYIERILEDFSPDLLDIICDTFWVQSGGCEPADFLRRLKGRAECIHLKDMQIVMPREQHYAVVGEGNLNFEKILAAAADADVKYLFVEQDDCYGEDPFDCLRRSYEFLKARGLS